MERRCGTDWRDAAAYASLLGADRSLFAWEWLRRDPHYADAAWSACGSPAPFGLAEFEAPDRSVPDARPLWTAQVHTGVLNVERSVERRNDNAFQLERFGSLVTVLRGARRDHLLLSDGLRAIRLEAKSGTFSGKPIRLRYHLEGLAAAERPLLTLRRLLAFCANGRFSCSLHPAEARARRWILMLRAHDALATGARQREIAAALLSRSAADARWRSREPSIRAQAQRLVCSARAMSGGGYRALLR